MYQLSHCQRLCAVNIAVQDLPLTIRAAASNAELIDDRWEPHTVQQHTFVPTSQFHLYSHVTSHGPHGNSGERRNDNKNSNRDDDDDDYDDEVNDVDDAPQLTVVCRVARGFRFYLLNMFLILVLIACTMADFGRGRGARPLL